MDLIHILWKTFDLSFGLDITVVLLLNNSSLNGSSIITTVNHQCSKTVEVASVKHLQTLLK